MHFKSIKVLGIILSLIFITTACSGEKSPKTYYRDGVKMIESGEYEKAEEYLSKATKGDPEKAEYYMAYGMSLIKTGKSEKALAQFDKVIMDKNNKIVRENNKNAYRGKGIAYYEIHDYEKAIEAFDAALAVNELYDLNVDILYYKGTAQEKQGLYEEAYKTFCRIILEENVETGTIYAKKAEMEYYLDRPEEAIEDYNQAISLDSDNYELYFGNFFMLQEMGKEEEAKEVLDKALTIKAKTDEDYYHVAKIHYFQGDYETAKEELADSASKGLVAAYSFLGEIYDKEKDYENAILNYEKATELQKNSKSASVYNLLGLCYINTQDYEKALKAFQSGIKLNDSEVMQALQFNEVVAYENLLDFEKALEKANAYLKTYKKDKTMEREYEFIKSRVKEEK